LSIKTLDASFPCVNIEKVPIAELKCKLEEIERISVAEWTFENVAEFIKVIDKKDRFSSYVDVFRDQKIDGESLLALNLDVLITHLNFKVGHAVQLMDHIGKLRNGFFISKNVNEYTNGTDNVRKQSELIFKMKEFEKISIKQEEIAIRWSSEEVSNYIENVEKKSFIEYARKFREQNIDGEGLLSLTVKDLIEIFQMNAEKASHLNDHLEKLRCSVLSKIYQ
jgi:hypothetical protein